MINIFTNNIKTIEFDALIIGGGGSGMRASLELIFKKSLPSEKYPLPLNWSNELILPGRSMFKSLNAKPISSALERKLFNSNLLNSMFPAFKLIIDNSFMYISGWADSSLVEPSFSFTSLL